jgi:hypothetical protein
LQNRVTIPALKFSFWESDQAEIKLKMSDSEYEEEVIEEH